MVLPLTTAQQRPLSPPKIPDSPSPSVIDEHEVDAWLEFDGVRKMREYSTSSRIGSTADPYCPHGIESLLDNGMENSPVAVWKVKRSTCFGPWAP